MRTGVASTSSASATGSVFAVGRGRRVGRLEDVEQAIDALRSALVLAVAEEKLQGSDELAERLEGWKIVLGGPRADLHRVTRSLVAELERGR